jgi:hypothetical protein
MTILYTNFINSTTDSNRESELAKLDDITVVNIKNGHQALRAVAYPAVLAQLDALWHDLDSGAIPGKDTSAWYQAIKAVKDQYPKVGS